MGTVSIVIPAYNAETTLDRCLNSILSQTYSDWELIAVDDGSTDGTREKLAAYAAREKRIRYFTIAHGGVSRARNRGLREAKGEYLEFVDADDELSPHFLETMIGAMERSGAELSICRFTHPFFRTYIEDGVYDLSKREEFLRLYRETFALVLPWNRVWKRKCFTVPYDEEVGFSEDELGNLANLSHVTKVATVGTVLYYYSFVRQDDAAKASCVKSIIGSEAFWNNRTSFYWLGARIQDKRRAVIERGIADGSFPVACADDMAYARLLDYCFWQMPAYIGMQIPPEGLIAECETIFADPAFRRGFRVQEKYGFSLLPLSRAEAAERTERFVRLCYRAFAERGQDPDFRVAYAMIALFLSLFARETGALDPVNLYAQLLTDLKTERTAEAKYVNALQSEYTRF